MQENPSTTIVSKVNLTFQRGDGVDATLPCIIVNGNVWTWGLRWLFELSQLAGRHGRGSAIECASNGIYKFAQFVAAHGEERNLDRLLDEFSKALDAGDGRLKWKSLNYAAGDRIFESLSEFCDWLAKQPEASFQNPNPALYVDVSPGQRDFQSALRKETDLLFHLRSLTLNSGGVKKVRLYSNRNRFGKRMGPINPVAESGRGSSTRPNPKGIRFQDYIKLIKAEDEPRNILLWLALGAGACRISEALQIFATDIFFEKQTCEAVVALANPINGMALDNDKRKRNVYLMQQYGLLPRCDLPKSSPLHAGWKGMIEDGFIHEPDSIAANWGGRRWTKMKFLMPWFARLFWRAHRVYLRERNIHGRHHPYYFINLVHNVGAPLTRSSVTQILKTSCRKAGIKPIGPHSLRHMYGLCLAAWNVSIVEAQILMRHASTNSTQVYYRIPERKITQSLQKAELENRLSDESEPYGWDD
jgi:integrase